MPQPGHQSPDDPGFSSLVAMMRHTRLDTGLGLVPSAFDVVRSLAFMLIGPGASGHFGPRL